VFVLDGVLDGDYTL